jgi:hypothetical protein
MGILLKNPLLVLSLVYGIFIGFVAPYNKDGLLRGHQMCGARPIKMPYTRDHATLAGFFDSGMGEK